MSGTRKPIIGVVSCTKELGGYQIQAVNDFYLRAVKDFGGLPIMLVPEMSGDDVATILDMCDGFLFPGSHSNVAPHRYNATHEESHKDEARDELSLTLIRHAVDQNIPCLGICRGFQEMNVALGGSLNPAVHDSGFNDHREATVEDFEQKYAPAHAVLVQKQSLFEQWLVQNHWENTTFFEVNTLHNQGVDQLAPQLQVEAKAPDGLVEAFSLPQQKFFVGVQWHPEWKAKSNHFSQILFKEFIMAASR
ncbi:TPA: gamma-glutamyl-gamma-aminobutyrate hydrolase family protein [Vibrio parahaemolyticus]|uniref:gamma-glutamyl-gamma-aminobutyrate hydrolase family protein n=1 Tax=Vibrio parahaemolyticus TaxID=670 RepID=UPI001869E77F|nr:gamma-glutamyl-gamma-aminobutyrate hydrolase family protein [Vibrio parahaemolyticus]EGR3411878.1 gamma-glutamyl-gamma-aminobutyrate hydrolase [Vibrio parahaemolyticus]EJE1249593.1 gamma-glutamyl-gamma-aminobutyrate hydrolase family protein [Vibrio parahaemolyticus]EJO9911796.1 gamma-glutamyl-gamma-aminobutyrate hydrolase family protein [Vibrio parahaemolyticus]MBE4049308.1 C26 family cysteine hydrolase domain-containing family [Vibrio parahaemolyticus]HCE3675262.1 gamma-glutamyl-gamma-amin